MTTTPDTIPARFDPLLAWADGSLADAAAVRVLGASPALLAGPWIRRTGQAKRAYWFDVDLAAVEGGYLSGGERRLLGLACSLASDRHPVDLGDAICGLDLDALAVVLQALAVTGGLDRELVLRPADEDAEAGR